MARLLRPKTGPGNCRKGSLHRTHYTTPLSWTINGPDMPTAGIIARATRGRTICIYVVEEGHPTIKGFTAPLSKRPLTIRPPHVECYDRRHDRSWARIRTCGRCITPVAANVCTAVALLTAAVRQHRTMQADRLFETLLGKATSITNHVSPIMTRPSGHASGTAFSASARLPLAQAGLYPLGRLRGNLPARPE